MPTKPFYKKIPAVLGTVAIIISVVSGILVFDDRYATCQQMQEFKQDTSKTMQQIRVDMKKDRMQDRVDRLKDRQRDLETQLRYRPSDQALKDDIVDTKNEINILKSKMNELDKIQ